ncbi:MAG: hypothetical protein QM723_34950 [Myxococcaceae bacterium]
MRFWILAPLLLVGCKTPQARCGFAMEVSSTIVPVNEPCRSKLVARIYPQTAPTVRLAVTRRSYCQAVKRQVFSDGRTLRTLLDPCVVPSDASPEQRQRAEECVSAGWSISDEWYPVLAVRSE